MRTIIAGTRDAKITMKFITDLIGWSGIGVSEVVSGCSGIVDLYGEKWARFVGIPVKSFPADWTAYGRKAGPIRNRMMAEYAEALIAVWDGKSRGTKNMIEEARKRGLKVYVQMV
jgi:hypothetical protein